MMRNKALKAITFVISFILVFSALSGCMRTGGTEPLDPTRTQLYIGNRNDGWGTTWLYRLKERFEDHFKDKSYEDGKVGVQLIIDSDKDKYNTNTLEGIIAGQTVDVYFAGGDNYSIFLKDKNRPTIMDITEIVRENLGDKYGEDNSIAGKLTDLQLKYFTTDDNKIYALPSANSLLGIVYDIDLFDYERFYFKKDGTGADKWTNLSGARSAGPDGEYGTFDDGLPATYDEFFELCARIKQKGMDAISFTGMHAPSYAGFLLRALWADYEGSDSASLEYNYGLVPGKNTTSIITGFDTNGEPIIKENHVIDESNYIDVSRQSGRYYALKFWEEIIKNEYYSYSSIGSTTHVEAQAEFLYSSFRSDKKTIAMLLEGSWWENEATEAGIFDDMIGLYGREDAAKENRNFGIMPMPKQSAELIGTPTTFYNTSNASMFVNANIKDFKKELVKDFIQFAHTDQSLSRYTVDTGAKKALNYDIMDEHMDLLTPQARMLVELTKNSQTVQTYAYSAATAQRVSKMSSALREYESKIIRSNGDPAVLNHVINALRVEGITARQYFEGYYTRLLEVKD